MFSELIGLLDFITSHRLNPCHRNYYMNPGWLLTAQGPLIYIFAFQSQEYKWLMEHWATGYLYIYFEIYISPFLMMRFVVSRVIVDGLGAPTVTESNQPGRALPSPHGRLWCAASYSAGNSVVINYPHLLDSLPASLLWCPMNFTCFNLPHLPT